MSEEPLIDPAYATRLHIDDFVGWITDLMKARDGVRLDLVTAQALVRSRWTEPNTASVYAAKATLCVMFRAESTSIDSDTQKVLAIALGESLIPRETEDRITISRHFLAGLLQEHAELAGTRVPSEEFNPELFKRIDDIDLPARILSSLQNRGIEYVWQLCEMDEGDLSWPGFRQKSIDRVKEYLAEKSLRLGMKLGPSFPRNRRD